MNAAIRPDDVLAECARAGVILKPGSAPGKVRMVGPAEAVQRLTPLVAQCKAELLRALSEQAAPEPPKPDPRLTGSNYIPATERELVRMLARVQRAEALGLPAHEAGVLADTLHLRDRDRDDRHLCVECQHVRADADGWRCAALRGPIPREWVTRTLQRCERFRGAKP
jgi:hypothetical protein